MSVVHDVLRTNTLGTLTVTVGANSLVLLYDRGDTAITGLDRKLNDRVRMTRRGKLAGTAWGDRTYPQISFSCYWTQLISEDGAAPGSLLEALWQLGAYTDGGSLVPPTCTLTLTIEGTDLGAANDETIVLTGVAATVDLGEAADGNTFSITGTVEGSVAITVGSNTITLEEID